MDAIAILTNKSIKRIEARKLLAGAIADGSFALESLQNSIDLLNDKQIAVFLEAVEAVTREKGSALGAEYLRFAQPYILSPNNSCKREASRIVGNMASLYPDALDSAIEALLQNTDDSSTVVRWGSAYALSKIVVLEPYKSSNLVQSVKRLYEAEQESGVRNQYAKALRRIKAL